MVNLPHLGQAVQWGKLGVLLGEELDMTTPALKVLPFLYAGRFKFMGNRQMFVIKINLDR